jgi:gliding motility-associated-like protein
MITALNNLLKTTRLPLLQLWWVGSVLIGSLILSSHQAGFAQSCPGLPGQPTINQAFGTDGNSPSLNNRTSYAFVDKSCPSDGEYILADVVDGSCFGNTWHTLSEDHTPNDVRGNMMIVNAAYGAGEFYRQPLSELCSGTTYEFSVWAVNLLRPGQCTGSDGVLPNLTISIEMEDGLLIRQIDIGSLAETATPVWRRYAATFTAPATTQGVIIKLINNRGGCGNDLALDDLQLKPCGACSSTLAFMPDVFTPNNDGRNDVLTVFLSGIAAYNLQIYDRWGTVVFASDAIGKKWDGTYAGNTCPTGSYTWVMRYQIADSPTTRTSHVQRGQVLLLR